MAEPTAVNEQSATAASDAAPETAAVPQSATAQFTVEAPSQSSATSQFTIEPPTPEPGLGASLLEHGKNIGENFLKAGEGTAATVAHGIHALPGIGRMIPEQGLQAMDKQSENLVGTTADKVIGYGGESLVEFLLGDEAIKGLGIGDRLLQSGKVAKILQSSPRLMEALKAGANMEKAKGLLSPEAIEAIKANPVLGRLVSAGMDAIRQGAVQGAGGAGKTLADTGSVTEAAKEGAKQFADMAGTSAVIGGATGLAGGVLKKAATAAGKAERVAGLAASASSKETVAGKVAGKIDAAEKALHTNYEAGIQDLSERLGDAQVSAQENPLAEKATKLLGEPVPGEHKLVTKAGEAARAGLDPEVKDLLEEIATGTYKVEPQAGEEASGLVDEFGKPMGGGGATDAEEAATEKHAPYTIGDLIGQPRNAADTEQPATAGLRQRIRETAERYGPGDINARTLKRLLFDPIDHSSAMDDTIEQLAQQSGDTTAVDDYQAMRNDYRTKINIFDDPVIAKIRAGKVDDAAKDFVGLQRPGSALPSAGKTRLNTENLRTVLGDQGLKDFGKDVFGTILKDAHDVDGQFNPDKFVKSIERITPESQADLFDLNNAQSGLRQILNDATAAARLQQLTKAGLVAGVGSVASFSPVPGLGFTTMLGMLVYEKGTATGRKLLDFVATHPNTLRAYQKVGAAATGGKAVAAANLAKVAAGKAVVESQKKRDIYDATQEPLARER